MASQAASQEMQFSCVLTRCGSLAASPVRDQGTTRVRTFVDPLAQEFARRFAA
jgi:hypothetical protein